tara:strand:+ start:2172 stop:2426 length:255 start_codon:yes stop_codon:yes gene_type:complete
MNITKEIHMEDPEYYKGIINTYNHLKGFGFIRREKGKDVFFFFEDFIERNANITIGDTVKFIIEKKPKGPRAFKIEVVSGIDQH